MGARSQGIGREDAVNFKITFATIERRQTPFNYELSTPAARVVNITAIPEYWLSICFYYIILLSVFFRFHEIIDPFPPHFNQEPHA
jgi:hypothetical protein